MNHLFRIATRTLAWGLAATLTLVMVVMVKGVHPEVLVAFKPITDQPSSEPVPDPQSQPPEQFAQVEPNSRLDSPPANRVASRTSQKRLNAKRALEEGLDSPPAHVAALPQLPPLPVSAGEAPATEIRPEVEILKSPAEPLPVATAISKAKEAEYLERLATLQQQLNHLAISHEQSRLVQQSWLESHQNLQQTKLQSQLNGIEANLISLQAKTDQARMLAAFPAAPAAAPAPIASSPKDDSPARGTPAKTTGTGSITRDEPTGSDGRKRLVIHSPSGEIRDLLNTLDKKAQLNLSLSINSDGDLEMDLKEPASGGRQATPKQPSGRVAERPVRKTPRPSSAQSGQGETFLPPVVKNPESPARIR